jgi:hypothetical protein
LHVPARAVVVNDTPSAAGGAWSGEQTPVGSWRVLTEEPAADMSTSRIFVRVIVYGLVLSAIDAVGGRLLMAAPDPSLWLSLGATAWIAYQLAAHGQSRIAFTAAITLFAVYLAAFMLWATLLVGWNSAVPWQPRSTRWMIGFTALAPVVALIAQILGTRASAQRDATRTNASPSSTP